MAVFGDVHGNVWALDAVLQAIEAAKADVSIFLGDAVLRVPAPREAMERLRASVDLAVRGNYDWFVIGGFPGEAERIAREPYLPAEVAWTRRQLTPQDVAYLERLPLTTRLFEGTEMHLVVAHASPGKAFGGLFPPPGQHRWGMTDAACRALLEGEPAPTILCGHTHAVMDRRVGRYRILNPGSVSLGWNRADEMDGLARWALLEWEPGGWRVEFREEEYDHRPVWEAYRRWELWPELCRYEKPRWWGERAREFAERCADVRK